MAETGCTMNDLTVAADKKTDPFRLDTPAHNRDGKWLADTAADLGLGDRTIHPRGLHYMVIGRPKPDGTLYENNGDNWRWMEQACKYARWLGHIPFDQIEDHRNAAPVIREFKPPEPYGYLSTEITVELPESITPTLGAADFRGTQPFKLVLVGEKSSLEPVLAPVAQGFEADLYLPTGDISDTLINLIAKNAKADGRPLKLLYFSDCDPSGWNMPVAVAHKLRAFAELLGGFDFDVYRAALMPDQVRQYGLPTDPLKETDPRGPAWRAAMGVEQTEIDALAALRPELLRQIAREACGHFFDSTLARRVREYRETWLARAREMVEPTLNSERTAEVRAESERQLDEMRDRLAEWNDQLRVNVDDGDLPPIELPEAVVPEGGMDPLCSSGWDLAEHCRALKASKKYES